MNHFEDCGVNRNKYERKIIQQDNINNYNNYDSNEI